MMPALSADYRLQRKDHSVATPEDDFRVGLARDWGAIKTSFESLLPGAKDKPCPQDGPSP
jgi:hypothetical protein